MPNFSSGSRLTDCRTMTSAVAKRAVVYKPAPSGSSDWIATKKCKVRAHLQLEHAHPHFYYALDATRYELHYLPNISADNIFLVKDRWPAEG